jgi:6-phosphofructokinase 2
LRPRIATLTLNPALDLACMAEAVTPTHKIRTFNDRFDPGGGGVNVARVLRALGGDTLALIATGGPTGRMLEELLDTACVPWRRLPTRGHTRISLNVHDCASGLEYRFVPEGPDLAQDEWHGALDLLREVDAEWIVASGSLPRGVPPDFYARAAAIATRRGQKFVLDASGPALRAAIGHGIYLLKPSLRELEFLIGRDLRGAVNQDREVAGLIRSQAADMIAVTLGAEGAILATRESVSRLPAIKVQARSTVGAGDSFLAGLVVGLAEGMAEQEALALAIAAGTAAVASYGTAEVKSDDIETFYRELSGARLPDDLVVSRSSLAGS